MADDEAEESESAEASRYRTGALQEEEISCGRPAQGQSEPEPARTGTADEGEASRRRKFRSTDSSEHSRLGRCSHLHRIQVHWARLVTIDPLRRNEIWKLPPRWLRN